MGKPGNTKVGPANSADAVAASPSLEDGPLKKRGCTDVPCLIFFLAFIAGMCYVAFRAHTLGGSADPVRFILGVDSWGNRCGRADNANLTDVLPANFSYPQLTGLSMEDRPFTFYFNPLALLPMDLKGGLPIPAGINNLFSSAVLCVQQCPHEAVVNKAELQDLADNGTELCRYDIPADSYMNHTHSPHTCPRLPLAPHRDILTRCVPSNLLSMATELAGSVVDSAVDTVITPQCQDGGDIFTKMSRDYAKSVGDIGYLCLIAIGVSFLLCVLMRFVAALVIWTLVIGCCLGSLAATAICWYMYVMVGGSGVGSFTGQALQNTTSNMTQASLGTSAPELGILATQTEAALELLTTASNLAALTTSLDDHNTTASLESSEGLGLHTLGLDTLGLDTLGLDTLALDLQAVTGSKQDWLIISAIVSAITVVIVLVLLVMRKRIALVVQLFQEAGKAVGKMPALLLQPIWTFLALCILGGGIFLGQLLIESAGTPAMAEDTGFVFFRQDTVLNHMKWYYLFGILWVLQFIYACQQMVISGAVAQWFFTREKKKLGWPILASTKRLIIFHLGTVAFGSFIIALVQLLRIILGYIQRKLAGRSNKAVSFLLKCLMCCLWCFEKFLKFVNKNAYIMTAIYGYNFCTGARKAFSLIVSNALRVGAINSVGAFCLQLGKLGTVTVTLLIGYQFFKLNTELCYIFVPLVFTGIYAFFIAHTFFSVYGVAIDTIFLCFCEDCQRNDGIMKPYYMSKGLMRFVENSAEAMQALEARDKAECSPQAANAADPSPLLDTTVLTDAPTVKKPEGMASAKVVEW